MTQKLFFLIALVLLLTNCVDFGSAPTVHEAAQCPDHPIADLNEKVGDLSNLLYRLDVSQMLMVKGGSDRFHTTISGHEPQYEKSEISDITLAIIEQTSIRDSIRSLFSIIDSLGAQEAPESDWLELCRRWAHSVETTSLMNDSLLSIIRTKAEGLVDSLASVSEFSPEATALLCGLESVGRGFSDFTTFAEQANDSEWLKFIPQLVSCGRRPWSNGWYSLVQALFLPGRTMQDPFLGQVSFHRLPELLIAQTGWTEIERWGGGGGTIDIEIIAEGDSTPPPGKCLVVLIPESGPTGSYYQTFHRNNPKPLAALPSGTYRLLLFSSGGIPAASAPIVIGDDERKTVIFTHIPFISISCNAVGGQIDTWVLDPSDGAHLNIPCNCPCPTVVWQGETVAQIPLLLDSTTTDSAHVIRRTGTFYAVVHCRDQTISGHGNGEITILNRGEGCDYELTGGTTEYTFEVNGAMDTNSVFSIEMDFSDISLFADRTCSGEENGMIDLTDQANLNYSFPFYPNSFGRAEVILPPNTSLESNFHFRTTLIRIF